MDVQLLLDFSDTYAPAVVLLVFWVQGLHRWPPNCAILYTYVYVSMGVFGLSNYLANMHVNNMFIYHFFALFEVAFAGWFVANAITNRVKRQLILFSVVGFWIFSLANTALADSLRNFNNEGLFIGCLVEVFFCFLFYLHSIDAAQPMPVKHNLDFMVVTGFFVYASVCSIVYYFYPLVSRAASYEKNLLWLIQDIALIIKYVLISFGLLWHLQTSRSN